LEEKGGERTSPPGVWKKIATDTEEHAGALKAYDGITGTTLPKQKKASLVSAANGERPRGLELPLASPLEGGTGQTKRMLVSVGSPRGPKKTLERCKSERRPGLNRSRRGFWGKDRRDSRKDMAEAAKVLWTTGCAEKRPGGTAR